MEDEGEEDESEEDEDKGNFSYVYAKVIYKLISLTARSLGQSK